MTLQAYVPTESVPGRVHRGGGLRRGITDFSRGSRKRLRARAGTVDWGGTPHLYFITLTFAPEHLPRDGHAFRLAMLAFKRRFFRRFPGSFLLLVREFGTRGGRLHLHAVMGSPVPVHASAMFKAWGNAGEKACRDGRWFRELSPETVLREINYIAKYASKGSKKPAAVAGVPAPGALATAAGCAPLIEAHNRDVVGLESLETMGRWWWVWGLENANLAVVVAFAVPAGLMAPLGRLVRAHQIADGRRKSENSGFWRHSDRKAARKSREFHARCRSEWPRYFPETADRPMVDRLIESDLKEAASITASLRAGAFRADYLKGWRPRSSNGRPVRTAKYQLTGWFVMSANLPDLARLLQAAIKSLDPWAVTPDMLSLLADLTETAS